MVAVRSIEPRRAWAPAAVGGLIALAVVLLPATAADAYYNSRTHSSCVYHLEADEITDGLGRLLAFASTDKFSGSSSCNTLRAKVHGNLFGIGWSLDSGYVFNGSASSGSYFGQCDSGEHWASFGGGYWSWSCP